MNTAAHFSLVPEGTLVCLLGALARRAPALHHGTPRGASGRQALSGAAALLLVSVRLNSLRGPALSRVCIADC